jgi:hypothetical protein
MEPEGSLPCSQELSIGPYPEPDQSSQYNSILSEIHFNIILLFSQICLVFSVVSPLLAFPQKS